VTQPALRLKRQVREDALFNFRKHIAVIVKRGARPFSGVAPFLWTVRRLGSVPDRGMYFHTLVAIGNQGRSDVGAGYTIFRSTRRPPCAVPRVRRSARAPSQFAFEGGKEAQSRARCRSSSDPLKDGRLRARNASRRQSRCTGSPTTVRTPGSSSDESSGDGSSGASERPQSCRPGTQGLPASEVDATSARSRLRQARKTLNAN
jgi:hypothetical protein